MTSFVPVDFISLYVLATFNPIVTGVLHSYSSKFSHGITTFTSVTLATSKDERCIPLESKYTFTSFIISLRTSKRDLKADA
jgi:hypothetical protein